MDHAEPPKGRGPIGIEEAKALALIALESAKKRGCSCQPSVGIETEGPAGWPVAHIIHASGCSIERGAVLVLGQPDEAERN